MIRIEKILSSKERLFAIELHGLGAAQDGIHLNSSSFNESFSLICY